jgi:hypothetical protein
VLVKNRETTGRYSVTVVKIRETTGRYSVIEELGDDRKVQC